MELTAREQADLAYKRRVYELALERKKALEAVVDDGYTLPTNYGERLWAASFCILCLNLVLFIWVQQPAGVLSLTALTELF